MLSAVPLQCAQPCITYPVPFGSCRAGSVLEMEKQYLELQRQNPPPTLPQAHSPTHRHSILSRCPGLPPGSRLSRKPRSAEHPCGQIGARLARLTLQTGTVRHSPGEGAPQGAPRSLEPPAPCTHLVSFGPQDTAWSLQEEGSGWQQGIGFLEVCLPAHSTSKPPAAVGSIPAPSKAVGHPKPFLCLGLDPTQDSGQAAPTLRQGTRL